MAKSISGGETATSSTSTISPGDIISNSGGIGFDIPAGYAFWSATVDGTIDAGIGIELDGPIDSATIGNAGYIFASNEAGLTDATDASFVNYGSLVSDGIGVGLNAGGTLFNEVGGFIGGGHASVGVTLVGPAYTGALPLLSNLGVIEGGVGVSVGKGVGGSVTVINGGTIASTNGAAGVAVDLGSGNVLQLDTGETLVGSVIGSNNEMALYGLGGAYGTVSGLGQTLGGINRIQIENGSTWVIEGNVSGLASGQSIYGFGPGDQIDISLNSVSSDLSATLGDGGLTVAGETIGIVAPNLSATDFSVVSVSGGIEISVVPQSGTVTIDVNALPGINTAGTGNDAAIINHALSEVPTGDVTDLEFLGGTFALDQSVMLGSNTNVTGRNSTILTVSNLETRGTGGQFENQNFNGNGAGVNTNISVRGLTFVYPIALWNIAIWFQNVSGVEISGNNFLEASNGAVAVLNATSTVIEGNVSDGNINGAYNGWNGLNNVAVVDNSDYQSGSAAGSGGYWFNGTYNPNAVLQGSQNNTYGVNNINSGILPGGAAFGFGSLGIGYTTTDNSNLQGDLYAANGTPSTFGFLNLGPGFDNTMEANIVSEFVSGNPEEDSAFSENGSGAGVSAAVGNVIIGNEVFGDTRSFQAFQNLGDASTTANDILIHAGNTSEITPLVGVEDTGAIAPIVTAVGGSVGFGTVTNGPTAYGLTISGVDNILALPDQPAPLDGALLSSSQAIGDEVVTLTISSIFGTISDAGSSGQTITLTGSISELNQDLSTAVFTSNQQGWSDDVHFSATDSLGNRAVWDAPVEVAGGSLVGSDGIGTFTSANSTNPNPSTAFTLINDPVPPGLIGETLVAEGGGHTLTLSSLVSMVLTADGTNTIIGGTGPGYIQTNTGEEDITLTAGGDITVSGGVGGVNVDAANGNDLIQSASGPLHVTLGSGADSVLSGVGGASVKGGSGLAVITTLPEDAGPLNAALGAGGGIVYALSGFATVSTTAGADDFIVGGQGALDINSLGNDVIQAGSGVTSVVAAGAAADTVTGGSGSLVFKAGPGNSYIQTGSGQTSVTAGSGSLVIGGTGGYTLDISSLPGTSRQIMAAGGATIDLAGGLGIISQTTSGGYVATTLSDGTVLIMTDPQDGLVTDANGHVASVPWGVDQGTLDAGSGLSATIQGSAGTLAGTIGSNLFSDVHIASGTKLTVGPGGGISDQGTFVIHGGLIDIGQELTIGTLDLSGGYIAVDPATIATGTVYGSGVVTIENASTLNASDGAGSGVTIEFDGANADLTVGNLSSMMGTIEGFSFSDTLAFSASTPVNLGFTSAAAGGILSISSAHGGSLLGTVAFDQSGLTANDFMVSVLGPDTEELSVSCFVEGTPIDTPDGPRLVETLKEGDSVLLHDGSTATVKWLAHRLVDPTENAKDWPVLLDVGSLGTGLPRHPILVSEDHAVLMNGYLVPVGHLRNGTIRTSPMTEPFRYFHVEVEGHSAVMSGGVALETYIDTGNRRGFDNFREYLAAGRSAIARPTTDFAPRLAPGDMLQRVWREWVIDKFSQQHIGTQADGYGHLDEVTCDSVRGWAALTNGEAAVVEIYVNGILRGQARAEDYRSDLDAEKIRGGRAAFHYRFEPSLSLVDQAQVAVKLAGTRQDLIGSPKTALVNMPTGVLGEIGQRDLVAIVIDEVEPKAGRDGGSDAVIGQIKVLASLGYHVLFMSAQGIKDPSSEQTVRAAGGAVLFDHAELDGVLASGRVGLVVFYRIAPCLALGERVKAISPGTHVILSLADIEHWRHRSIYRTTGIKFYEREAQKSSDMLRRAVRNADQIFTHSSTELVWLRTNYPDLSSEAVLWTPQATKLVIPGVARDRVAFIGNMKHAPNVDAVWHIERHIQPAVAALDRDIAITIAGSDFTDKIASLDRAGLVCSGEFDDISVFLASARLTIAPLRCGAGVKSKVLSSLAAGVPCVMSPVAADGIELPETLACALVFDDPKAFAEAVVMLYRDDALYMAISSQCEAWARATLSVSAIKGRMEEALFNRPAVRMLGDAVA